MMVRMVLYLPDLGICDEVHCDRVERVILKERMKCFEATHTARILWHDNATWTFTTHHLTTHTAHYAHAVASYADMPIILK